MRVEVRGLVKRYPAVLALDHASLTVDAGQIVGLLGRNGAGKSTMIKVLAGAVRPDEGRISIDGKEVEFQSPVAASAAGLAFVHQELVDAPSMSVAENVFLGLGYPKRWRLLVDRRELRRRTEEILARIGARIDPRAPVGSLPIAQQRLVMIARGLAAEAKLFVLDEPTASLTAGEVAQLHGILRRLASDGVAIVYVSHRLDEILALTSHVVVMRDGRVVAERETRLTTEAELVHHITGDEEIEQQVAGRDRPRPAGQEVLRVSELSSAAVHGVSFSVRSGEVLGIAGLVGAGRTELARLIFGADKATSGEVVVRDQAVRLRGPRSAMEAGLGFLPEDRRSQGLITGRSIRENITLASLFRFRVKAGIPLPRVSAERRRATEVMGELRIAAPDAERPVQWLSGGNQQKVVLGKWLERSADIMLLDEPTHGVDVHGKAEIHAIMRRLADEGRAVVFISSEFGELVHVCDRVLVMREGQVVAERERSELSVPNLVSACYANAET